MHHELWQALERMRRDTHGAITELRAEMRTDFKEVGRALLRQAHNMDQGFAKIDEILERHRENVATVVVTYVEDLNGLKTDVRALKERVEILERERPPAA